MNIKYLFVDDFIDNFKGYMTATSVVEVVTPIVFGTLLFLGLFANAFVAYVTITTKRISKHPLHSLLVLNLAAADLLYLFSSALYQVGKTSYFGNVFFLHWQHCFRIKHIKH